MQCALCNVFLLYVDFFEPGIYVSTCNRPRFSKSESILKEVFILTIYILTRVQMFLTVGIILDQGLIFLLIFGRSSKGE